MTKKTHTQKDETVWQWEETPETIEALKQLHQTVKEVNQKRFAGNYEGPLYAPHPDINKN